MYYKVIQFDPAILRDNAESFFKGQRGWFSRRKILSLEGQHIIRIFDRAKPGSAIQNYARYTLGKSGWKEYMGHNLQEMPAKERRDADYNIEAEQPFALFADIHRANKDMPEIQQAASQDGSVQYFRSADSTVSLMEIRSRKNKDQTLLFIVLGKIPRADVPEKDWEESILVLRSSKSFDMNAHPAHLVAIEEIRASALIAYKERNKKAPVVFETRYSLPIHKVAQGNIYIAEEHDLVRGEIPEDVKQDSLKHLAAAVSDAFTETARRELKTINACLNNSFDPQDYLIPLAQSLEANAPNETVKDILADLNSNQNEALQLCVLMTRMFYSAAMTIKDLLHNPLEQVSDKIPALLIIDAARQDIEKYKFLGSGNIYNSLMNFIDLIERKLRREEELAIPPGCIVIDKNVSDSMLQVYIEKGAAGIIALGNKDNDHAVLKAKAVQFPFLIGADAEILDYIDRRDYDLPADMAVFYGNELIINPTAEQKNALEAKADKNNPNIFIDKFEERPVSLDGQEIKFKTNFFYTNDAALSAPLSGEIGLLRDEMLAGGDFEEMCEVFRRVARLAPHGVTWRTLDVSRIDKLPESIGLPLYESRQKTLLDYICGTPEAEERIKLRMRAFFAVAQEFPQTPFNVMYPMIFTAKDAAYYQNNFYQLAQALYPAAQIHQAVMIETPEAVQNIAEILPLVDFISVGSNDLTMTVLHQNTRQRTVQGLAPQVLAAIQTVLRAANEAGKEVCVCGDMASNPVLAVILLALGKTNFSAGVNFESAVCKQACAYVLDKNLLPRIREILTNTNGQNYIANVYQAALELFKDDALLYEYICNNYAFISLPE